jgi:hypothetical protein
MKVGKEDPGTNRGKGDCSPGWLLSVCKGSAFLGVGHGWEGVVDAGLLRGHRQQGCHAQGHPEHQRSAIFTLGDIFTCVSAASNDSLTRCRHRWLGLGHDTSR